MCGFAGSISLTAGDNILIKKTGQTIAHRGPDYTGYYSDTLASFVHNRLSLVDVSANGNQPFTDEQYVLLFNGELYNHKELKAAHLGDIAFHSSSDTETLFHLLRRKGVEQTAGLLKGMFSFAWYEKQTGRLFLCRDRLGIKPLFYSKIGDSFIFCSELKGITSNFPTRLDQLKIQRAGLGEFEYTRKYTAFENVFQLEPGTILSFNPHNDQTSITTYFRIKELVDKNYYDELHQMPAQEVMEEFHRLFYKSVESMMMSDVGMGVMTSGGLDSSIIAAMASKMESVELFTANTVGRFSELGYAEKVANLVGRPLHVYDFQPEQLLTELAETTWYYESPIVVHSHSMAFQGVARLTREKQIKCILTGEGSDELFLGYPRLLTRNWDKLINLPFSLTTALYSKIPGLTRYLNLNKVNYDRDLLNMPFGYESRQNEEEYHEAYSFVNDKQLRSHHFISLEMLGRSLHSLLWRNDRMGMMQSIEARFPFLDEDVLRFAANVPIKYKIGKTWQLHNYKHPFLIDKYIVRKATQKYLPTELAMRTKIGFSHYGYQFVTYKDGFFRDGFLSSLLQLDKRATAHLENTKDPYLKAKLAAVEVWGRLYDLKQPIADVSGHVIQHAEMKIK
jgi:asparagine synthase (glutamine-hydrolysing)